MSFLFPTNSASVCVFVSVCKLPVVPQPLMIIPPLLLPAAMLRGG